MGAEAADEFCRACHTATGGNPLFLRELLRALDAAGIVPSATAAQEVQSVGPAAVSRFVLHRLAALGPAATELARVVAVLGDGSDVPLAARVSGLSVDAAGRRRMTWSGPISLSAMSGLALFIPSCGRRCMRIWRRASGRRGTPRPPKPWLSRPHRPSGSPGTSC